jgi:hypothetical protein
VKEIDTDVRTKQGAVKLLQVPSIATPEHINRNVSGRDLYQRALSWQLMLHFSPRYFRTNS